MQKKKLVLFLNLMHVHSFYLLRERERDFLLLRAARMVFAADFLRSDRILDWNCFFE